jgi:hypothetical protein
MTIRKSISLFIVSALLVLPSGIARAGDIDVQTANVRVTVGKDGGINIQSRAPRVIPHRQLGNPSLRRQHWPKLNRTSKHNTWIKQSTLCNGRSYSHQSTQTSGSGSRGSQTQSSTTSTTVCR